MAALETAIATEPSDLGYDFAIWSVARLRDHLAQTTGVHLSVDHYYYYNHQKLREHLQTFLMTYNLAKRLKTLGSLTPYEFICQQWQKQPELFLQNLFRHHRGTVHLKRR